MSEPDRKPERRQGERRTAPRTPDYEGPERRKSERRTDD